MIYVAYSLTKAEQQRLSAEISKSEVLQFRPDADGRVEEPDIRDVEILMTSGSEVTPSLFANAPALRWIQVTSAGVDMLPLKVLRDRNILLTNARGVHGVPMAEQIFGMMLSFSRNLHGYWRNQKAHQWKRNHPVGELFQKELLIVGAGAIGQALASRAKVFGMIVTGIKANPAPLRNFDQVIGLEQASSYWPKADFVVVLAPLTPATHHLINSVNLARMKPSAVVVNFARGGLVDQPALIEALQDGRIGGAGLDVFEDEPLPSDSPLWSMDNVLITPHIGGWTPEYNNRLIDTFLQNLAAYRQHRPLPTAVDLTRGY